MSGLELYLAVRGALRRGRAKEGALDCPIDLVLGHALVGRSSYSGGSGTQGASALAKFA